MKTVLYEGPDISYHNGAVNIKAVRDAGYKRIGIRAGYGKNNVDQKYTANAEACFNLGVPVMLYWFSYAYTTAMAAAEAGYAVAQAGKYWKRCPIAFDFEYDSVNYARKNGTTVTKTLATDMAVAFLKAVRAAGYIPVIYTNKDYMNTYFDMNRITAELGSVYVWYARYISNLPAADQSILDIWQYTSSGKVAGISGKVDMNRFYTDFNEDIPAERETKSNINILDFQRAANADGYKDQNGKKLEEDGLDGPKTQYVRGRINAKAKRTVLGYKVGSTGTVVSWIQRRLKELGYGTSVDGKFGKDTRADAIRFQKDYNLTPDGVVGYDTIQMMFYN